MEKRAGATDATVLFFKLVVLIFCVLSIIDFKENATGHGVIYVVFVLLFFCVGARVLAGLA